MSEVLEKVREFFREKWEVALPKKQEIFKGHFEGVLKHALKLAEEGNADKEIIEIAVWFHDISTLGGEYEEHHIKSAEIAEEFLLGIGYPKDKIKAVKHCILVHRGSRPGEVKTKEAQILKDADAMDHFDYFSNRGYKSKVYKTNEALLGKLERTYAKLSPKGKVAMKDKFEKAKEELG